MSKLPLCARGLSAAFSLCLLFPLYLYAANVDESEFENSLVTAAIERTRHQVTYDGAYRSIPYPGGDVPANIGVCSDVIIRSYRQLGVDLQQLVHEDMKLDFEAYPSHRIWGMNNPDSNIDHRRVPNLQAYFTRHGKVLPISEAYKDYHPGDIVTWMLPGNLPHIGIVTNQTLPKTGEPLIVHNIGRGPQLEDMLFDFDITGHYRFDPTLTVQPETMQAGDGTAADTLETDNLEIKTWPLLEEAFQPVSLPEVPLSRSHISND